MSKMQMSKMGLRFGLLLLHSTCLLASSMNFSWDSRMPPRLQWENNEGYCGETSTIAAGLKYGQYFSQYDLRAIASPDTSKVQTKTEYLVGVNDQVAAANVRLSAIEFPSSSSDSTEDYLAWIKQMTRSGYSVTICVYMNYYLFYDISKSKAGDREYDHIVSVSKIESNYDDDVYHGSDVLTFSDHGLYAPDNDPIYLWSYNFSDFIGNRQTANAPSGNVYTLPEASKNVNNYGIAHTGPAISNNDTELFHVMVTTNVNYEEPVIKKKSNKRPMPMEIILNITVFNLNCNENYYLYKYDNESKIPENNFNLNNQSAVMTYLIQGQSDLTSLNTFSVQETIMSDEKAIYRAVRADAS